VECTFSCWDWSSGFSLLISSTGSGLMCTASGAGEAASGVRRDMNSHGKGGGVFGSATVVLLLVPSTGSGLTDLVCDSCEAGM
jgi:hypothetical protein